MKLVLDLEPKIPLIDVRNLQNKHVELAMLGHKPVIVKKALEFDHFREYLPSDDARLIDWKASLRAGKLQVRMFQEDKSLSVLFLVDTSSSMVFGTREKLKIEYSFELLASMCFGILNNQDKVGLSIFNDQIVKQIPPTDGVGSFGVIQETLYNFESFGGMSNMIEPIFKCNEAQKEVNIVIIISDFISIDQDFSRYLAAIPQSMDAVGIMISDPVDISIPNDIGLITVKDPFTGEVRVIDSWTSAYDYNKRNQHRIDMVKKSFDRVGGSFLALTTSEPFDEKMMNFLGIRNQGVD